MIDLQLGPRAPSPAILTLDPTSFFRASTAGEGARAPSKDVESVRNSGSHPAPLFFVASHLRGYIARISVNGGKIIWH
jgi:hypothetical protein